MKCPVCGGIEFEKKIRIVDEKVNQGVEWTCLTCGKKIFTPS